MSRDTRIYRGLLLVAAMLLATIAIGWWGVLLVAMLFAVIDGRRWVPEESGVAAALAWLALFVFHAVLPGSGIIGLAARAMAIPELVLPLLTILFPALLAWSSAAIALALARLFGRERIETLGAPASASAVRMSTTGSG